MQRFIGTKTILARPITRGEYNAYRGWNPPAGEDQSVQGYLVEYTDGGTPNDSRHAGYISWSPKEQFDNAYRARPLVPGLLPHQQRVVDEKAELDERLRKLMTFTVTPTFAALDEAERNRLAQQAATMAMYSDILADRIAAFAPPVDTGGQLIATGRNPHYEGRFEGETAEQAQARRAAATGIGANAAA
jgi:hypothetical protein